MATNNINSNYFSVASYSNTGMSGMISGLDTESMVKQMLSATQKKIDKQNALAQQTIWRQEFYRDIINAINTLRNKYFNPAFDAPTATNLLSAKFYNSMVSTVSAGSAAKVISTAYNAPVGETRIVVEQLASAAKLTSQLSIGVKDNVTGSEALTDALADERFNKTLVLQITDPGDPLNPFEVTVDLNGVNTQEGMLQAINGAISAAGSSAVASVYENRLRITDSDPTVNIHVLGDSTELALQMTGLTRGAYSSVMQAQTGQMLQGGTIKADAGVSLTVNLDGVVKQITLNPLSSGGQITASAVADNLNTELDRVFGNYIDTSLVGDRIELRMNFGGEEGHTLTVSGAGAEKLGISSGASSRLSTSSKIGDLEGLSGERFSFTINGKDFSFSKSDTIGAMINTVNAGNAGVQLSFSSLSGKFSLTAASTGSQHFTDPSQIRQTEGNLLGAIFQTAGGVAMFDAADSVASATLTAGSIQGEFSDLSQIINGGAQFRFSVDGVEYMYSLPTKDTGHLGIQAIAQLNYWLRETFGTYDDSGTEVQNIEFVRDTTAMTAQLEIRNGAAVSFAPPTADITSTAGLEAGKKTDLALALGLNVGQTSNFAAADTLADDVGQLQELMGYFTGGGASFGASTTVQDVIDYANTVLGGSGTLSFDGGRLVLQASGTLTLPVEAETLFGGSITLSPSSGQLSDFSGYTAGADAMVTINGVATTRSSNTFEFDGMTIQLTSVSEKDGSGNFIDTVINTERNTEGLVDVFKSFVEDYNAMIDKLNGYIYADTTYKKYDPLTAEQKKEMSEKEIELWEEQAKGGLLRNDSIVSALLNNLYSTLYTRPSSSGLALYDLGIESPDYLKPGRLTLDETKLREMLASEPAAVEALFTDPINGIATRMNTLMDNAARISIGNPGSLVQMAGVQGSMTDRNSIMYDELTRINERLKTLQDKYEKERQRYWNQFNAMEQIMAQYMAQSSYMTQALADLGM